MITKYAKNMLGSLILTQIKRFSVRVRYAPSPTGFMHIGGLRTAYFNYIFAKKEKGQFIVRIEDTDTERQVQGSIDNIFQTLQWIQAIPDESIKQEGKFGPYIQSERMELYKNIQKGLLKTNKAYPCFCGHTKDSQNDSHDQPYDGKCRKLTFQEIKTKIKNKQPYAVRIKADIVQWPKYFKDEIFGQIQFKPIQDFIIVRSNGIPTFHLANVIDDHQMNITHVLRGEEWLTSTNKHIYLYKILGFNAPKFVHLPLIKSMAGKKLAKRDPQSQVKFFQTGKYQVWAVKNFIYQLGLSRLQNEKQTTQQDKAPAAFMAQKADKLKQAKKVDKKEEQVVLLSESQMIKNFNLSRITKVPIKFDIKQLDHLNRLALQHRWKLAQTIQSQMHYFINRTHQLIPTSKHYPKDYIQTFLSNVHDRFNFITDIQLYAYYFEQPDYFTPKSTEDFEKIYGKLSLLSKIAEEKSISGFRVSNYDPMLYDRNKKIIHTLRMIIEHIIEPEQYTSTEIAKKISEFLVQSPELKNEDVYHMLRYMVIGRKSGPNITAACQIIGRQKILKRIAAFSSL